jgi:hypothetical protein
LQVSGGKDRQKDAEHLLAHNRQRIPPTGIHRFPAGGHMFSGLLFWKLTICIHPILSRFQEGAVTIGADEFQRLHVLSVFVTVMIQEAPDGIATFIIQTVPAGDVSLGQAAFLHFAFGSAQIPQTVQIS